MKKHSQEFKEKIKEFGRQLDSKITYDKVELGGEQLNAVTPNFQSALLKSVMKELDIDSNVEIPVGTIVNYKLGVLLSSGDYEYLDYGNYQVYSCEKQEDTNSYNIVAYDKMLNSMIEYTTLKDTSKQFPMSVRDYIGAICNDINLVFKDSETEFANYDKVIQSDLYANLGYTYRDILDELAQVTASNIIINDKDQVEIKYITDTGDTIDKEYLKDINVAFGEKYGPINSIVLSRSAGADNVYLQDEQSIADNGLHELKISDNQIMNNNDRSDYLPDILEKLNGLKFYINDFYSTGICYYEVADKYNIKIGDVTYSCVMFNDEIQVAQGLEEIIYTELPEQAETDYTKADKTDRKINQTYLIVDKQNQSIQAAVETAEGVKGDLNLYIKKNDKDEVVSAFNLNSNEVVITSDNFKLDAQGNIVANNANLHEVNVEGGDINLHDTGEESEPTITINDTSGFNYKNEIKSYNIKLNYEGANETSSATLEARSLGFYDKMTDIYSDFDSHLNASGLSLYDRSGNNSATLTTRLLRIKNVYIEDTPTQSNHAVRLQDLQSWVCDERYKKNIKDSEYQALNKILNIKHKEFDFKYGGHVENGYIADELEEIDKSFIIESGEDKIKHPQISSLIPAITKAIQEQQEIINKLEKRIEKLEEGK